MKIAWNKICFAALLLITPILASAQEVWFGFYMQGQKVGYSNFITQTDPNNPKQTLRTSEFKFDASMLGQNMQVNVKTWTWLDSNGKIIKLRQLMNSSGRTNDVVAIFSNSEIKSQMTTGGDKSEKTTPIPAGAYIIDDPLAELNFSKLPPIGESKEAFIFATDSLSLQKINIVYRGLKSNSDIENKEQVHQVSIIDPRAPLEIFFTKSGNFIKATGPLGMEYRPESKSQALTMVENGADLALVSSIPVKGIIPLDATSATFRVTGADLSQIPNDKFQKVQKLEKGFQIATSPNTRPNKTILTKDLASKEVNVWLEPDIRVPSDSENFKKLAKEIIGNESRFYASAQKLRQYVHNIMGIDAGIGVMRDANEILQSKVGVCRDHAILLGTLTKAAGIPTKFVSGVVYTGRDFLYHAWVEVWDGTSWIALDSTRPGEFISPGHVKTAQGSVGESMTGFLLDGAKFEVVDTKSK